VIKVKKIFSLKSNVTDDNHDTYKTANIKINQLFLNASSSNEFSNFILLVKYMSLNALNRIRSPFSTFAPVKSFTHVSVSTDDKVYNCKTAAINFIYLSIVSITS
jgi:hypothetical protein